MSQEEEIFLQNLQQKLLDLQEDYEADIFLSDFFLKRPKVKKMSAAGSIADNLIHLSEKNLQDYRRYLKMSAFSGRKKEQLAASLMREFRKEPELLLYLLDKKTYQWILDFEKLPDGARVKDVSIDFMNLLVYLGLGTVDDYDFGVHGKQSISLGISHETVTLLKSITEERRLAVWRQIENFEKETMPLIRGYGFLPIEDLVRLRERYFGGKYKKKDFHRLLYWHNSMQDLCQTGTSIGSGFVAFPDLNAENMSFIYAKYGQEVDYKVLRREELESKSASFSMDNPSWDSLHIILGHMVSDWSDDEIDDLLYGVYDDIFSGMDVGIVVQNILDNLMDEVLVSDIGEFLIWKNIMELMMNTRVGGLKGYSRKEYASLTGADPYSLDFFDGETLEPDLVPDIEPYFLPADAQIELYEKDLKDLSGRFQDYKLVQKLKKLSGNFTGQITVTEDLLVEKHWDQKEKRRAERDFGYPGDDMDFDFWEEPKQVPYRREGKKIMPNDPCPCGSGKKYKKCCGKNRG